MFDRAGRTQRARGADVIARAVGVLALAALAVIDVVDCRPRSARPRWQASGTSGLSPQRF
jgi:hypothetical protein